MKVMTDPPCPVVFLSGAGGGAPDLSLFRAGPNDITRFETIGYPGWRRFAADGLSAEDLIAELAAEIATRVPHGPIRIVGLSIGGHFGYGAAIRLQMIGREIAGFCAIDTSMYASAKPSPGWKGRHLAQGLSLLRNRRLGELTTFLRSLWWRALIRSLRGRLPDMLRGFAFSRQPPAVFALDPIFERELSMRMLIRAAAPWIESLNREPVPLNAPATLLRTPRASGDDQAWQRRCPNIEIVEISGEHHSLFEPENIGSLREAFIKATRGWRNCI